MLTEPLTVTLDAELLGYLLPALACLSYPFWGAVTAGLWGRKLGYTREALPHCVSTFDALTRGQRLALLASAWPATLPAYAVAQGLTLVARLYSPVTRALLPRGGA